MRTSFSWLLVILLALGTTVAGPIPTGYARAAPRLELAGDAWRIVDPYRYDEARRFERGWNRGADALAAGGVARAASDGTVRFVGTVAGRRVVTVASRVDELDVVVTYTGLTTIDVRRGAAVRRGTRLGQATLVHVGVYDMARRSRYLPVMAALARAPRHARDDGLGAAIANRLRAAIDGTARAADPDAGGADGLHALKPGVRTTGQIDAPVGVTPVDEASARGDGAWSAAAVVRRTGVVSRGSDGARPRSKNARAGGTPRDSRRPALTMGMVGAGDFGAGRSGDRGGPRAGHLGGPVRSGRARRRIGELVSQLRGAFGGAVRHSSLPPHALRAHLLAAAAGAAAVGPSNARGGPRGGSGRERVGVDVSSRPDGATARAAQGIASATRADARSAEAATSPIGPPMPGGPRAPRTGRDDATAPADVAQLLVPLAALVLVGYLARRRARVGRAEHDVAVHAVPAPIVPAPRRHGRVIPRMPAEEWCEPPVPVTGAVGLGDIDQPHEHPVRRRPREPA